MRNLASSNEHIHKTSTFLDNEFLINFKKNKLLTHERT